MTAAISVSGLTKTYASGSSALKGVDLEIRRGEIFALLGPNGAGKTTLINIICGIVTPTSGVVLADGHDIQKDARAARRIIGLVPQELTTDAFETVWSTVSFSRGLFGRGKNPAHIERVLKQLSLWDKKDSKIMTLSGGMKRRVLIAKACRTSRRSVPGRTHRRRRRRAAARNVGGGAWAARRRRTVILTTHYIEEAELMADRIGVISKGEIILVEEKGRADEQARAQAADAAAAGSAAGCSA
jgi:ABC-2 type transport system ATP-binding protein